MSLSQHPFDPFIANKPQQTVYFGIIPIIKTREHQYDGIQDAGRNLYIIVSFCFQTRFVIVSIIDCGLKYISKHSRHVIGALQFDYPLK